MSPITTFSRGMSQTDERDKRITFDAVSHTYYVDGRRVPLSVTGLVGRYVENPFNAEEKAATFAKFGRGKYAGRSKEDILAEWSERATLGTRTHEKLEDWMNNEVVRLRRDRAIDYDVAAGIVAEGMLARQLNAKPYRAEWRVWHEHGIAGTIDAVFIDEAGALHLVDWKRKEMTDAVWTKSYSRMTGPLAGLRDSPSVTIGLQLNAYVPWGVPFASPNTLFPRYRHILECAGEVVASMRAVIVHTANPEPVMIKEIEWRDMAAVFEDAKQDW